MVSTAIVFMPGLLPKSGAWEHREGALLGQSMNAAAIKFVLHGNVCRVTTHAAPGTHRSCRQANDVPFAAVGSQNDLRTTRSVSLKRTQFGDAHCLWQLCAGPWHMHFSVSGAMKVVRELSLI